MAHGEAWSLCLLTGRFSLLLFIATADVFIYFFITSYLSLSHKSTQFSTPMCVNVIIHYLSFHSRLLSLIIIFPRLAASISTVFVFVAG